MSWNETVLIAIISAVAGGVIGFFAQHVLPALLVERIRERRELSGAFRRNASPLMYASYQLFRRLQNILEDGLYEGLAQSWQPKPHWPMTQEYFIESTQYLFGVFLAHLEQYYLDIFHLAYGNQKDSRLFCQMARDTQRALYDVSLNSEHLPDHQVYLLDQKAMGEALLIGEADVSVLGFFEFRNRMRKKREFRMAFSPIRELIVDLRPDDGGFRFERLQVFAKRLTDLYFFLGKHTHGDIYSLTEKIRVRGDRRECIESG